MFAFLMVLDKECCNCENTFGNRLIHLAILVWKGVWKGPKLRNFA